MKNRGFTLIEVLVALFILTGGIVVLAQSWSGNFMRVRKSALFNDVATLLERKMVEIEAKYKDKPLTEIPEEDGGDFEGGNPQYTWKMKSRELKLPDLSPLIIGREDGADESLLSMIKQMTETISKSVKEVRVAIVVKRNNKELEFAATQYFVDYNQDLMGGLGGAAGGGGGGANPPPKAPGR